LLDWEIRQNPADSGQTGSGPPNAGGSVERGDQGDSGTGRGTAEFFGITAYGTKFVYILDMSTSMSKRGRYGYTRFQSAAFELMRSLDKLALPQDFHVILFSYQTRLMFDGRSRIPRMLPATPNNKQRMRRWLSTIRVAPGTDPRLGLIAALRMKPDAIFLLTDGEFNGRRKNLVRLPGNPTVEEIVAASDGLLVPIHTIAFADKGNRDRLQQLSAATGGRHRFVSGDAHPDLVVDEVRQPKVPVAAEDERPDSRRGTASRPTQREPPVTPEPRACELSLGGASATVQSASVLPPMQYLHSPGTPVRKAQPTPGSSER
jgi:hypothetical protein